MYRVGVIGCGGMGHGHAGNLAGLPEVEVVGTADIRAEAAQKLAARFPGCTATGDPGSLLARDDVDIIVVATPTDSHAHYIEAAAEHGKHVFSEKPLARTMEQADEALAAVKAAGVRLMVGLVLHWFPEYVAARQALDEGAVGQPAVMRTSRLSGHPRASDDWYADFDRSGGLILDMLIHDLDLVRWYLGDVERVFARSLTYRGLDHTDYALITLRMRSGAIAHIEGSWALPMGNFITKLEIAGDQGLLEFDNQSSAPLRIWRKPGGDTRVPGVSVPESPTARSPYQLEDEHFITCLREDRPFAVTAEDARAALAAGLAALESSRTGEPVTLV
jgi:UDP-N-acetylglucosamine 3-dehydrogenase